MREVQGPPSDLLDRAREAYLAHCGSWGGFDNADEAREWAQRSASFSEQVESYSALLADFALRYARERAVAALEEAARAATPLHANASGNGPDGCRHLCPICSTSRRIGDVIRIQLAALRAEAEEGGRG